MFHHMTNILLILHYLFNYIISIILLIPYNLFIALTNFYEKYFTDNILLYVVTVIKSLIHRD